MADRTMANSVDPVLGHHTSQERQPAAMLQLLDDKPHQPSRQSCAEDCTEQIEAVKQKITAEEQAGFRVGRRTTEQIFNLRILCENISSTSKTSYHVFMGFKKVFNKIWHAAFWATMKKFNIRANLT